MLTLTVFVVAYVFALLLGGRLCESACAAGVVALIWHYAIPYMLAL
jgi:hypothetical protein